MPLTNFLSKFPNQDAVYEISKPRPFLHPEEAYDQRYSSDNIQLATFRKEAGILVDFLEEYGLSTTGPVLEIGCGTGRLSASLVLSDRLSELLLTDASPAFCSLTSRRLVSLGLQLPHVSIAVLQSEDLDRLPPETFSLVIMRSVLHHISDVSRFFRDTSIILRPGGLMVFEEPCHEGYLLMGALTQMMPDLLIGKGISLNADQMDKIQMFVNAMQFYARRDIDKSLAEDKHLFRPDELMTLGRLNQMELHVFSNRTLAELDMRSTCLPSNYFERFYFNYLKYCMSWDDNLIELFSQHMRPYFDYFSCLAVKNALPHTYGTFLCRKQA